MLQTSRDIPFATAAFEKSYTGNPFTREVNYIECGISWNQSAVGLVVLPAIWLGRCEPAKVKAADKLVQEQALMKFELQPYVEQTSLWCQS